MVGRAEQDDVTLFQAELLQAATYTLGPLGSLACGQAVARILTVDPYWLVGESVGG